MKIAELLVEDAQAPKLEPMPNVIKAMEDLGPNAVGVASVLRAARQFTKIIPMIEAGLASGEILNTDFDTVKSAVNSFSHEAYSAMVGSPFYYQGRFDSLPEDLKYMDTPFDLRGIGAYAKRITKLSASSKKHPAYLAAEILVKEVTPLIQVMAYLKDHVVKASDRKKQIAAIAKSEEDVVQAKYTNHKDAKKVSKLLKETAADIEKSVYESCLKGLHDVLDRYNAKVKSTGSTDYRIIFKNDAYSSLIIQSIVERIANNTFKLVDAYEAKLESEAKRTASDVIDHFVYKNAAKLAFILYTKDDLDSVTITDVSVQRGVVECDVNCKFKDGASFTAASSVVYAVSKLGNWFYRYPTLFNKVYLPDGSRMTGATEQKMNEVFAEA
jgi:Txe/YoeB family toxin of Txe-Axe toxin-antitoxin module